MRLTTSANIEQDQPKSTKIKQDHSISTKINEDQQEPTMNHHIQKIP